VSRRRVCLPLRIRISVQIWLPGSDEGGTYEKKLGECRSLNQVNFKAWKMGKEELRQERGLG
jgi:hypothetical protein